MHGYLAHHRTALYGGIRADKSGNDPYVWRQPYLASFCHAGAEKNSLAHGLKQRNMKVLWLSKVDGVYCCDLVFVVGQILPIQKAAALYGSRDPILQKKHFTEGFLHHPAASLTFVADMNLSYIPHPAVPIEQEVDRVRRRERNSYLPLAISWGGEHTSPLRIEAIDELEHYVRTYASSRPITWPLTVPRDWNRSPSCQVVSNRLHARWMLHSCRAEQERRGARC